MEAYFQACAVVIGGTCLVGSCLLTKHFVGKYSSIFGWAAIAGVIALILFGKELSAFATQILISQGFGPIGAGLGAVAFLSAIAGVVFAFFTSNSK